MNTNTNRSRLSLVREYVNLCNGFQQNMQSVLNIYQDMIHQIPTLLQPRETTTNPSNYSTRTSTTFSRLRPTTNYNWNLNTANANTNSSTANTNLNTANTNIGRSIFAYVPRQNIFGTGTGFNYDNLQPVIVRPTPIQLLRAVDYTTYNSTEITQEVDPIDQIEFTQGEYIVRIRQCGHCFRPNNFSTWFDSHVRCPLCRLDIRDISENINNDADNDTNRLDNTLTEVSQLSTGELSRSRPNNQQNESAQSNDDRIVESLINYANSLMGDL